MLSLKLKRIWRHLLLGALTCIALISAAAAPSFSKTTPDWLARNADSRSLPTLSSAQPGPSQDWLNSQLMAELQEAESVLLAQGMTGGGAYQQRYAAILTNSGVVPNPPSTSATGSAGAVLVGDRLVIRGDFANLSSPLRDYATDPASPPNPNITSGVHIHRGELKQNGPFQYALTVNVNDTGLGGRFTGNYTLTAEQRQALTDGKLYLDIHTRQNRTGELRGVLRAL